VREKGEKKGERIEEKKENSSQDFFLFLLLSFFTFGQF